MKLITNHRDFEKPKMFHCSHLSPLHQVRVAKEGREVSPRCDAERRSGKEAELLALARLNAQQASKLAFADHSKPSLESYVNNGTDSGMWDMASRTIDAIGGGALGKGFLRAKLSEVLFLMQRAKGKFTFMISPLELSD